MRVKILPFFLFAVLYITAQENNFKFRKVSKDEVAQVEHPLEKDAEAAILYKKERVYYDYDGSNGFRIIRNVHHRIKIYDKSGLDWGTVNVSLYTSQNGEETISSVKGYTYNLENGKVVETKLKKEGIFKEKVNKYRNKTSIAMPNVKEGSVIELEYKIISDFVTNIDDFQFQYGIPINKVEVSVEIPEYFVFKRHGKGYYPIDLKQSTRTRKVNVVYKEKNQNTVVGGPTKSNLGTWDFSENIYEVNVSNIPSLKEVVYTDNINNYRSAIKFELASTRFPNRPYKNYSLSWEDVAASIYKFDDFGGELKKTRLVKDYVDGMKGQSQSKSEMLQQIYDYIKNNITWNNYYGVFCENGIKKTLDEKTGNVADINLTLVTMLRYAGFDANPVLVSTKSHGIPLFPTREGFNYVIAAVNTGQSTVLLDATEKMGAIGILPPRAMNWKGRLIKKEGTSVEIDLTPKELAKELVFMNASILEDGSVAGKVRKQLTHNYAYDYRESHKGETWDEIMDGMEERYLDIEVNDLELKNEKECNKPLVESCSFSRENQAEIIAGKIYFRPALFMALNENPFKLEQREYPVDFSYPQSKRLTVNFMLPEGYQIESAPESKAIGLPDGLGTFKYVIKQNGSQLQFNCQTDINRAIIPPNYYESLKEFYDQMLVKQTEQVVLSKI
ncbi:MAG: DUF3857 domain-containing protein [Bacteroidota bacterium]